MADNEGRGAVFLLAQVDAVQRHGLAGAIILLLQGADWLDGRAFGLTALACALVWQVFQVLGFLRSRRPVYDEAPSSDGAAVGGAAQDEPAGRHTP